MAIEFSLGIFASYVARVLNKTTDYLRGDVAVTEGITALMKTVHLAAAFGMNYAIHYGGNRLNN